MKENLRRVTSNGLVLKTLLSLSRSPLFFIPFTVGDERVSDVEFTEDVLKTYKVSELKSLLKDNHFPVSGKRQDLIYRILGFKKIAMSTPLKN